MEYKKSHKTLLSFLVLLTPLFLHAQDPHFNHYTEDEELLSNEVYNMEMDEQNILYIATDRGLVVHDGYDFSHYTTYNNLTDNCILRLNKTSDGKIWLTTIRNSVNYIEHGAIKSVHFNEALMKTKAHEHFVQHIYITSDSDTLITFNKPGLFRVSADGSLEKDTSHFLDADGANLCIFESGDEYYWDLIQPAEVSDDPTSTLRKVGNKYYLKTFLKEINEHQRKELAPIADGDFYFSYCNKLFHIKSDSICCTKEFEHDILSLKYDSDLDQLWVGIDKMGAYCFEYGNPDLSPKIYLEGQSVTSILIDHEHNYWFSVRNNGVYRTNSLDHLIFKPPQNRVGDNRITSLECFDGSLFFGTQSGRVYKMTKMDADQYKMAQVPNIKSQSKIRSLFATKMNSLLVSGDRIFEIDQNLKPVGFKTFNTYPYEYLELGGDTCILSLTNGLYQYKGRTLVNMLIEEDGYQKITQTFKRSDHEIWLSSRPYGLFVWDGIHSPVVPDLDGIETQRSNAFASFNEYLVLGPYGFGLYLISEKDTIELNTDNSNLSGNMVDDILVDKSNTIWVATNEGISRINFQDSVTENPQIDVFSTLNGLPSNRVYQLAEFDGFVWAATGDGLVRIQNVRGRRGKIAQPVIEKIFVNDKEKSFSNSRLTINHKYPHSIRFNFKSISYFQPHKIYYYYFCDGVDDENENWAMTTNLEVRYPDVTHGEYALYLKASSNENERISGIPEDLSDVEAFSFIVNPKFTDKSRFRVFLIVLIAGLITFITTRTIIIIRKREENKQRLLLAEKTALLSQMNPHFIFNSLNSIQHYIIQQDSENANLYLAKFSQLIRKILENSKKKWISLNEEIESITLYLNLEKLRFEDNFDFVIKPARNIDLHEILVPPMMIQPFVENAIWHGIMPLKKKGYLVIEYAVVDNHLMVSVEDNGIGREESAKKKRISGHTPTGLKNVNERIILLNKMMKETIACDIIDLKDSKGKPKGTRVELSIPILNNR